MSPIPGKRSQCPTPVGPRTCGWTRYEPGWYHYRIKPHGPCVAAVCWEGRSRWCVYVEAEIPPGDSSHRTLKEAQAEAERLVLEKLFNPNNIDTSQAMTTERRCATCVHYQRNHFSQEVCQACYDEDLTAQGLLPSSPSIGYSMVHFTRWTAIDDGFIAEARANAVPGGSIILYTQPFDKEHPPLVELKANGDILVRGKVIENDHELVIAFREFLHAMQVRDEKPTGLVHRAMYDQVVKELVDARREIAELRAKQDDDDDWGHLDSST